MRLDPTPPSVPTTRPISPTATARSPLVTAMSGLSLSGNRPSHTRGEQPPSPVWHTRPTASSKYFLPAGTPSHLRPEALTLPIEEVDTFQRPDFRVATPHKSASTATPPSSPVMPRPLHPGSPPTTTIFSGDNTADAYADRTTTPSPVNWPPPGPGVPFRLPPSPDGRDFADKAVMAEESRDVGVQVRPRVSFRTMATVKQPGGVGGHTISHTPITGSPAIGMSSIFPLSPPVTPSDISLAVSTPSAARALPTTSAKHEPGVSSPGDYGRSVPQGGRDLRPQRGDTSHGGETKSSTAGLADDGGSRPTPTRIASSVPVPSLTHVVSPAPVEASPAHVEVVPSLTASCARVDASHTRVDASHTRVDASHTRVEVSHAHGDASSARVDSPACVASPARVVSPAPSTSMSRAPIERVLSPDSFVEIGDRELDDPSSDEEQYWSMLDDPFAHESDDDDEVTTTGTVPPVTAGASSSTTIPVPGNTNTSTSTNFTVANRGYHYTFFGEVIVGPDPPHFLRGKTKYIVIVAGRRVGVFRDWTHASPFVIGCPGARYKGYRQYSHAIQAYQREKASRRVCVITL
ncbi:hypothetical protein VTO73DRAFT_7631 [Trametes versicolor]